MITEPVDMGRPHPLAAFLAAASLLAAACGGPSEPRAAVQFIPPTPTAISTPGLPTPTPEPVDVLLSTERAPQGGTVLISVTGPIQSGSVQFLGRRLSLVQGSQSMYTFAGIATGDTPGIHVIRVEFMLRNGSRGSFNADFLVTATNWEVDRVTFTPEQQALLDPAVVAAENDALQKVYGTFTPRKLWSEPWQFPTLGGLTAPFGGQRAVNGGAPSGHHSGTDFGAAQGTDVLAANSGHVVFAGTLSIRGTMVIIDHGGGLLSGYAHLAELAVAAGQDVRAGQLIGRVGSTGLSTGAHLHWEMSASGVLVDPVRFADGSNGF